MKAIIYKLKLYMRIMVNKCPIYVGKKKTIHDKIINAQFRGFGEGYEAGCDDAYLEGLQAGEDNFIWQLCQVYGEEKAKEIWNGVMEAKK